MKSAFIPFPGEICQTISILQLDRNSLSVIWTAWVSDWYHIRTYHFPAFPWSWLDMILEDEERLAVPLTS